MADKPATPQRDDMAAVALDTVLLDEEPTADQVLTAVLVLMDFVAYAGAAAMLWINREFLMLHGTNAVTLPIATAIFVVTINFVRGLLIAARFLTAYACKGYTASCALAAACVARVKTWVAFGSESHQRSVKSSVCDVHMAPRGEASLEGGELSTSRFAGSIEISLNDNSLETEEDVAAIAAQLAAAGFDEIEHSSGVAIPRPSEDCTEPSWLIEAERILFETSAFASNLEGSAFERADDVPDIAADHVSLLGSTSPSPSTPPDKRRETSDVNRTAELVTSGVCDISGPPPRVSTEWSVPSLHGVLWIFTVLLVVATIPFAVAVSGPVPASMPLPDAISIDVPLPDTISINGACHLWRSPAPLHQHGLQEGRQETSHPSTTSSPAPRHGATQLQIQLQIQISHPAPAQNKGAGDADHLVLGGCASVESTGRRPTPLPSAAPCVLHPAIGCGPTPTPPVGPLLRGADRGGARGKGAQPPTWLPRRQPRLSHKRPRRQPRPLPKVEPRRQPRPPPTRPTNQLRPLPKRRPRRQSQPPKPRRQPPPPRASPGGTFSEFATSAPSPSAVPSKTRVSTSSSSVLPRLARPALFSPARETPAPPSTPSGRALPPPP